MNEILTAVPLKLKIIALGFGAFRFHIILTKLSLIISYFGLFLFQRIFLRNPLTESRIKLLNSFVGYENLDLLWDSRNIFSLKSTETSKQLFLTLIIIH
jgi:hypothetical protein